MMLMISSERMAIWVSVSGEPPVAPRERGWWGLARALDQLVAEPLQAAPHAGVEELVADAARETADERLVDLRQEGDVRAGHPLDAGLDGPGLVGGEGQGARDDGLHDAALAVEEAGELGADRGDGLEAA